MSKKSSFRRAFDNQHCKPAQTLLESEREHLQYLLITEKAIELEEIPLRDMKNPKILC